MNHVQAIRARLDEHQLDAILLTHQANRFYATGFMSSGTDGAALITPRKAFYFTDSRYTEAAGKRLSGVFDMGTVTAKRNYETLFNEVIASEQLRRVGFEDASMTVAGYRKYKERLNCELVPASDILKELRQVKDADEIRALTDAQRIAEKALLEILNDIRPGAAEREIAAKLQYLMLHYGAEDKSFDPIVVSGANGSLPHGVPTERAIQDGEFVTMDFGCVCHGYCSDMTRTVAVGHVTDEMRRIYDTVLSAQLTGIETARAGVTGKDVDAAARDVITKAGYGEYFAHSFGHGVGVEIHEYPNASSLNEKPLPAGAVISAEPGIYIPGKLGVRIEDVIVITETGRENLMKAPKELLIL
ncbi:MAG: aminopeptidase P family protein [Oscillibacter sp.]|nr:aminopeptidase P family protein [Oscillibacter sp.]